MITTVAKLDAYRQSTVRALCTTCRTPAVFSCPACGRTFCPEHAALELCADCAAELQGLEHRTGWAGALAIFAAAGAVPFALLPWPDVTFVGFSMLGGGMVGLGYRQVRCWLKRRAFRRRAAGFVLDGAELAIARGLPEDAPGYQGSVYACRTRGELPSVPMWQRTYGR